MLLRHDQKKNGTIGKRISREGGEGESRAKENSDSGKKREADIVGDGKKEEAPRTYNENKKNPHTKKKTQKPRNGKKTTPWSQIASSEPDEPEESRMAITNSMTLSTRCRGKIRCAKQENIRLASGRKIANRES